MTQSGKPRLERADPRTAALAEKLERAYRAAADPVERARLRGQLLELAKTRDTRPGAEDATTR